jgi:hypothetical protein
MGATNEGPMTSDGSRARRAAAGLLGAAVVAFPAVALANGEAAAGAGAVSAFGPLFVLAIAIERFWETVFTGFEHSASVFGRVLGAVHRPMEELRGGLDAAQSRYDLARRALTGSASSGAARAEADTRIVEAEALVALARARVIGVVRDPVYMALKRRVILYGSAVLGPVVAYVGNVTLLQSMGITRMPAWFDILITGVVIGGGSEPMHGLVNSVESLNRALCGMAELAKRAPDPTPRREETDRPQ